jgi:hypothetical protein
MARFVYAFKAGAAGISAIWGPILHMGCPLRGISKPKQKQTILVVIKKKKKKGEASEGRKKTETYFHSTFRFPRE